ncbi:MAG: hypothetical protein IJR96_05750 [Pseudobutyrivibrio sp.]|nr:hypothetical protein [Pseudobutyrivibrio sp.]
MRKLNSIIKKITVCLFAVICLSSNYAIVANADEVEGSDVAIIEIQDYTVEGGMIEAGKEITVNLTIHNTASNASASSILMTMSNSSGSLYPVYGNDNQVYVGTISAGGTKSVSVPLTIGDNFVGNAVDLICDFKYETAGMSMNNVSTIVIPTSGGSTIGVKSIDVSTHAIVNGKSLLSFSYVNQSSSNITDAALIIDGNVSSSSREIQLDTVYAGKSYTGDYYVTFKEAGNQEINISLQYTDVTGETVVTDLGTFGVTVSKENVSEVETKVENPILKWAGRGIAGLVFLAVVVSIIVYIKKK